MYNNTLKKNVTMLIILPVVKEMPETFSIFLPLIEGERNNNGENISKMGQILILTQVTCPEILI